MPNDTLSPANIDEPRLVTLLESAEDAINEESFETATGLVHEACFCVVADPATYSSRIRKLKSRISAGTGLPFKEHVTPPLAAS